VLIETIHYLLKMLEKFSKAKAFMVVRKKKRKKKTESRPDSEINGKFGFTKAANNIRVTHKKKRDSCSRRIIRR
jgi:hypothetical protein